MKKIHIYLFYVTILSNFPFVAGWAQQDASNNVQADTYHLVWQDLFNGTTLDETNNWKIEVNGDGGGNSELQYYRRENISVGTEPVSGNGCLIITAKKENYSGKTCTSGRLTTFGKMSFKHGKIEARIKLPKTANGLWPAFWMLGADYQTVGWPKCGEMDMLEMGNVNGITRGTQDKYYSGWFHWGESWNNGSYPNWGKDATSATSIQDDFHLFTLIWDDAALKCYLDLDKNPSATPYVEMAINGEDVAGNAAHYFHKKFFVIFNLAIGGNFTQIWDISKITALNNGDAKMYVDYVKVYQKGVSGEEFSGPALTSVKSVEATKNFVVYTSATSGQITITSDNQIAKVIIYNLSGQKVMTVLNQNQVDISSIPHGNYLLKISDITRKTETHKLVK